MYKDVNPTSERGGVPGAMDTLLQRGTIQKESLDYEHKKHDGSLPLVGVNTYFGKDHGGDITTTIDLIRSTEEERASRSPTCAATSNRNAALLPSPRGRGAGGEGPNSPGLAHLQSTARKRENLFAVLIEAVKTHSLGQISYSLYGVGEEYRWNM